MSGVPAHTAGPWIVDDVVYVIGGVDSDQLVATGECGSGVDGVRHRADLALIAAAPDLLEALKPFAECAEHDIGESETDEDLFRNCTHNRAPKITVGHLRAALAAIAKATGERQS